MIPLDNLQLLSLPESTVNLPLMIIPPVLPRKCPLRPVAVPMSARIRKRTNVLPIIMPPKIRSPRELLVTLRVGAKEFLVANGAVSNEVKGLASFRSLWNWILSSTICGLLVLVGW
jgi:hypothetical protein